MTETAELDLLRDSTRKALSQYPDALGFAHGDDLAPTAVADLMATAAAQGWMAMLLPEARGGLGLGMREAVIVAEEAGRALAPGPLEANAVLVPLVAAACDAAWMTALAADVAGGETVAAVGVADEGCGPRARVFVEHPTSATVVLRLGLTRGRTSETLVIERLSHPDLKVLKPFDPACPLAELLGFADVTDHVALNPDATAAVLGAAQIWIAADLLGAATRAGEMSVAYAGTRKQFGTLIGTNQAIKHRIVDDYILRQNAAAIIADAARAWDARQDDRLILAHAARAAATSAAIASTAHCIQVHGAIGFSAESSIHLAYKRVRRLACSLGDEARSRAVIAAHLVAGTAA